MEKGWNNIRDVGIVLGVLGIVMFEWAGDNAEVRLVGGGLAAMGAMAIFVGVGEGISENLDRIATALEAANVSKVGEEEKQTIDN